MTISPARLAANQANAQRSTGPRTVAGKAQSRLNAYKHGLCASTVLVGDEATVQARLDGVMDSLRPRNEYQLWLCGRIAATTVKLDRLAAVERQTRIDAVGRAEDCWDEDQEAEAARIGARLARHPSRTVGQLRRTLAGCEWLMNRWAELADAADQGEWTDAEKTLAHDLLATPPEFRGKPPERTLDRQGRPVVPQPSPAAFARARLAELEQHLEQVLDSDEIAQLGAMADLDDLNNRDLGRLRRYERAMLTDIDRAVALSQHESPQTVTDPQLLKLVPAQFRAPESESPAPTLPAATLPNEPISPAPTTPPNEPKIVAPATPRNEPKRRAAAVAASEPREAEPRWAPAGLAKLDPTLAALLEAGMPQPGDLDPDWCNAVVAAHLSLAPADPPASVRADRTPPGSP